MNLTIVADENIPAVRQYFGSIGQVRLVDGRRLHPRQLEGADVLLVRSVTWVNKALLAGTGIRFVGTATSGVDHVDRDYLAARDIGFASAPGANANSVVEYVLAAIAAVGDTLEKLMNGGVVGIVGCGHIGRALSARLHALGIYHRVYDPWLDQAGIPCDAGLDEVLACNVVTLHPELTTREPWPSVHLLDAPTLEHLTGDQLLINASRGEVIDNQALGRRLSAGEGPVTVLDVWEGEPGIDPVLVSRVRLASAHIAGYSLDGKLRGTRILKEALVTRLGLERDPGPETMEERPMLDIPVGSKGPDLIRKLLLQCYDITEDDRLLRASLREPDPAAAFDRLRKHYRVRRELASSRVRGETCTPEQLEMIRALGCEPVSGKAVR